MYEAASGWQAVLPMVRLTGLRPRRFAPLYSMPPAWGMGGLVCSSAPSQTELAAVASDLRSLTAVSTRIRPNPLHAGRWHALRSHGGRTRPRLAHVLDLDGGPAAVWQQMAKRARQGVRRGERSRVEIECDTTGRLVPVFYELLMLSVERWAAQQNEPLTLARARARRRDPLEKFTRMAGSLGDAMRVWVAWKDGAPAAAMVVLIGANASDIRGAMNKELTTATNANDLLQWHAIQDACRAGCRRYHLGESGASLSLAHFKEKFGAKPVPYAEHLIERLPLAPADATVRRAVKRVIGFKE
jgi:hypothetical protein